MKYHLLLGCTTALVCFADVAVAKSPAEIESLAKSVTVQMITGTGSGVIFHRQGNLYTIVTSRHVVCGSDSCDESRLSSSYRLRTPDGQIYSVPKAGVKLLKDSATTGLDLAIVQFRSSRSYPVAQVAGLDSLKAEAAVYSAGFPKEEGFNFGKGIAVAVVNRRIIGDGGGYTIVYNAETLPGMSGGGVFDQNGRLVAIHGQGDRYRENTEVENISLGIGKSDAGNKIGYNRGIPVRWVVQGLKENGIILGQGRSLTEDRVAKPAAVATADEFFITGFNKLEEPGADVPAGKREAISLLSKAIAMKPSYAIAYFMRGFAYEQLQLDSKALADYNQAISLNLKDANVYIVRGRLKSAKLNDAKGALADFNQAISLNPKASIAYNNRGTLKYEKLNDAKGALADFNQAISLNPKFSLAYINRGFLKFAKLNDDKGALADFNQAISLNPRDALAYSGRGLLKYSKLKDPQGALADYNQALALNPKFAEIYVLRGMLKHSKLNDRPGGIADVRQAAKLARAQNNQALQAATRQILKSWGLNE